MCGNEELRAQPGQRSVEMTVQAQIHCQAMGPDQVWEERRPPSGLAKGAPTKRWTRDDPVAPLRGLPEP